MMSNLPLTDDPREASYRMSKAMMEIADARDFIEFQKRKISKIKDSMAASLTPSWYMNPCFVTILYVKRDYGYDKDGNIDVVTGIQEFEIESPVMYLYGFKVEETRDGQLRLLPKLKATVFNEETGKFDGLGRECSTFDNENVEIKSFTIVQRNVGKK